MDERLATPVRVLQLAFGLTATLAGLDKFFNLLADWGSYVSPLAAAISPLPVSALMAIVGVVEMAVGATVLVVAPRLGAYVVSVWLLLVAANLVIGWPLRYRGARHRDVDLGVCAGPRVGSARRGNGGR